jgi:glycosyltransferase involved in cell wall biosynthesis
MQEFNGKHIVIIIEGFPVPLFKILMQHAAALKQHGADVSIISPKLYGLNKSFEVVDGIAIYRHPMPFEADNVFGFFLEYSIALIWQLLLLIKISCHKRIHVIQGCTPPDLVFLPALLFKMMGIIYIYYQLDLNPELYLSKFHKKGFFYRILILLERLSFRCADYSIVPNESFKTLAIKRSRMDPGKIAVIRSGPDINRIKETTGDIRYKNGKKYLIGYLGVICRQDSLELLIDAIKLIVAVRQDVHFILVGDGPDLPRIRELAGNFKVRDYITFYGMVEDAELLCDIMSTCDMCVNSNNPDGFNDNITSIKIMEYMAFKKPIVQFDCTEDKFTAQQASLYAEKGSTEDFAAKINFLLDHEDIRVSMGESGYQRIVNTLSWKHECAKLLLLFTKVFRDIRLS